MASDTTRVHAKELQFFLYDRPIHPEFFEVCARRHIACFDWHLALEVTASGHHIQWHNGTLFFDELIATSAQSFPRKTLMHFPFQGERRGRIRPQHGIAYYVCSQREVLLPEIYLQIHDEILNDARRKGLVFQRAPEHRLAPSPLTLITADACPQRLILQTFHTFPSDLTLIKTQTLIEKV